MKRGECPQCGVYTYVNVKDGMCQSCLNTNIEQLEEIETLIDEGHTEHCAQRLVWGDGQCECGGSNCEETQSEE